MLNTIKTLDSYINVNEKVIQMNDLNNSNSKLFIKFTAKMNEIKYYFE